MKQESPQVETSNKIKPDYPDELDKLRQQFQKKHGSNFDQFYIAHPNIKMLYCYLFFSFAPITAYKFNKIRAILDKMMAVKSQHQQITYWQKKLSLDWQKGDFIEHTLQKKSNLIVMHKRQLEKLSQNLDDEDCKQLITSSFGSLKINIGLPNDKSKPEKKNNLHITMVKTDKMPYIVFYQITESQKKRDKSEIKSQIVESQIKPDGKQKVQRQNNEPQKKQKLLQQNNEPQKKKQRPMPQTKLKASKSVGSQIEQPPKVSEKNDITWYEVAIILIIIFALAAEHTALFDDFLVQYNEHMGYYYVLDVGYKLNNFFFPTHQ